MRSDYKNLIMDPTLIHKVNHCSINKKSFIKNNIRTYLRNKEFIFMHLNKKKISF